MPAINKFYFDFYFNGKFIRRFNSKAQAESMIFCPKKRTYPAGLYEIKKVRKRKLSTQKKDQQNQELVNLSRVKNEKLSTGVTNLSSYGVKLSPHIKKKENKIKNLKKEKEKNAFPCEKGGEEDQHRRPPVNPPNLSTGGVKNMKNAFGGVGFSFSGKSGKKKEGAKCQ